MTKVDKTLQPIRHCSSAARRSPAYRYSLPRRWKPYSGRNTEYHCLICVRGNGVADGLWAASARTTVRTEDTRSRKALSSCEVAGADRQYGSVEHRFMVFCFPFQNLGRICCELFDNEVGMHKDISSGIHRWQSPAGSDSSDITASPYEARCSKRCRSRGVCGVGGDEDEGR